MRSRSLCSNPESKKQEPGLLTMRFTPSYFHTRDDSQRRQSPVLQLPSATLLVPGAAGRLGQSTQLLQDHPKPGSGSKVLTQPDAHRTPD